MKPRRSKFVMLAVSVALAGGLQSASAGEIAGRVTDASTGRPLPSATVRIPDLNLTTRADRSGNFRLNGVPPGSYTVEVDNVGFQRSTQTVAVSDGAPAALAVAMSASGLEEVVVSGTRLAQKTALQDKKVVPSLMLLIFPVNKPYFVWLTPASDNFVVLPTFILLLSWAEI